MNPAVLEDRRNLAIKIVIEESNHSLRPHTVGQQGEFAQSDSQIAA
jgi:hypothetical protein